MTVDIKAKKPEKGAEWVLVSKVVVVLSPEEVVVTPGWLAGSNGSVSALTSSLSEYPSLSVSVFRGSVP